MKNKMKNIYILTDYKNYFGSNYDADPYRSGFDHATLKDLFKQYSYLAIFINMVDVQKQKIDWRDEIVLYTSNEEPDYYYKEYIEDIIQYLKLSGALLIPHYELLRANNNKSFMELYKSVILKGTDYLESQTYGCLEDMMKHIDDLKYPIVFKTSSGAMSRGVALAKSRGELISIVKKFTGSATNEQKLKEILRQKKHKGYVKNSNYQKKFILQPFIPNLQNDWKVLIFGGQLYILKRGVRKNDFRASGSHVGYLAGLEAGFSLGHLDRLIEFKNKIGIPNISLDYVFDGKRGYIIEFQGIYFGLSTINYCKDFYIKENGKWITKPNVQSKEELYVYSIKHYLDKLK